MDVGDIEAYVRQDLRNALALTLDLNAYLGTGAGASPLGILNKVGVQTNSSTFAVPATPTLAELDAFATSMILKLTTSNIFANDRWRWLMPYRTAMRLADMRTSTGGDIAYPEMNLGRAGGPIWKGIPVIITSQIPTNGGAGTNETTIALVDFNHVLFGEEEGITVRMSDQATLNVDGGSTLVHLWQQNMFAILCEAMHDFGLRTVKAVVKQTAIVFESTPPRSTRKTFVERCPSSALVGEGHLLTPDIRPERQNHGTGLHREPDRRFRTGRQHRACEYAVQRCVSQHLVNELGLVRVVFVLLRPGHAWSGRRCTARNGPSNTSYLGRGPV